MIITRTHRDCDILIDNLSDGVWGGWTGGGGGGGEEKKEQEEEHDEKTVLAHVQYAE